MDERILTRHPEDKQGVNIRRDKYEQMRAAIKAVLWDGEPLSFGALNQAVSQELQGEFDGSISWYFTTVKLDLEARGVIHCERTSGKPQMIHWVQD